MFQKERPKGREPIWRTVVSDQDLRVFSADWIGVRLSGRDAAWELGAMVSSVWDNNLYRPPKGHLQSQADPLTEEWSGMTGDWSGTLRFEPDGPMAAGLRAEHLDGPYDGGVWWWAAQAEERSIYEHQTGISAKSADTAKWLASLAGRFLVSQS